MLKLPPFLLFLLNCVTDKSGSTDTASPDSSTDETPSSPESSIVGEEGQAINTGIMGYFNSETNPALVVCSPNYKSAGALGFFSSIYGREIPFSTADLIIQGEGDDRLAQSCANVGDVNGDGYEDLLAGTPTAESNSGVVYLLLGSPELSETSLTSAVTLGGSGYESAGYSVAGAGDVDGDGYPDLVVGAPDSGEYSNGAVYLILGSEDPYSTNFSDTVQYSGEREGEKAGFSVDGAGDVDGDGYEDLLVGAPYSDENGSFGVAAGAAYLVFGSSRPESSSLTDAGPRILGYNTGGMLGYSVAGAGNFNGDENRDDEFIVSAPYGEAYGDEPDRTGTVYVFSASRGWRDVSSIEPADGNITSYNGGYEDYNAGVWVAGGGDIYSDYDDIAIAVPGFDVTSDGNQGAAVLLYGTSFIQGDGHEPNDDIYRGRGEGTGIDYVSFGPSLDGNGRSADLLVGSSKANKGGGEVWYIPHTSIDPDDDSTLP